MKQSSNHLSFVIYVEDCVNARINSFIQENIDSIAGFYKMNDTAFLYLPFCVDFQSFHSVLKDLLTSEDQTVNQVSFLQSYVKIKQQLVHAFKGTGLVWLEIDEDSISSAIGCQLIENKPLLEQFQLFANVVHDLSAL